ncbi:MAG TPA: signal peptidase II [Deltaproteobacteria bacterium]|nr:signal peptidase II [Deltaproteobacteria bacterium]
MKKSSRNTRILLVVFLLAFVSDQLTKAWVIGHFHYGELHVVIPGFFNLTYVRNPGGAFSFLATLSEGFRQVFFMGTGLVAVILLIAYFRRLDPRAWIPAVAIGSILGGAIGNLTDRVLYGEVIDFLDFRLIGGYVWPTFNLADSWIVIGVGILMIEMFLESDQDAATTVATGEGDPDPDSSLAPESSEEAV